MADMTEREAIEWLEKGKKYLRAINRDSISPMTAIDMAISALSAQIPRLLSLDEAKSAINGTPVWKEYEWYVPDVAIEEVQTQQIWCTYGSTWRWWIGGKPTAEQMAATPWTYGKQEV